MDLEELTKVPVNALDRTELKMEIQVNIVLKNRCQCFFQKIKMMKYCFDSPKFLFNK